MSIITDALAILQTALDTHNLSIPIAIAPFTSTDVFGKPSYGTAVTYRAVLVDKRDRIRDARGDEVEQKGEVFVLGDATISVTDQVTLPDGSHPLVKRVEHWKDATLQVFVTRITFGASTTAR